MVIDKNKTKKFERKENNFFENCKKIRSEKAFLKDKTGFNSR